MPVQITIFLLLFGGLQGLLFTLFLVRKKLHRSGYIFLLFYFAVLLMQITLKVMSKGWLMGNWPLLYQASYHLPFLYGPFAFLFVRQMTGGKWKWIHLLHFLPFTLALTAVALRDSNVPLIEGEPRLMYQLFSISIYHGLAYSRWDRYNRSVTKLYPDSARLQMQWLKRFLVASFVLCSVIAITIYFMYVLYPSLNWLRMGFVALTVFIYWVSYSALTQPDIFYVAHSNPGRGQAIITEITPKLQVSRAAPKYRNSSLPDDEAQRIVKELEQVMTDTKPQLDPEMNIDKLAQMVNSNRHHLSQVLNDKIGLSFYDYINSYRVNEAMLLLSDPARSSHKIASIAYDSGFNSLSAFNDVFKKMTGQTPSQHRKHPHAPVKVQRG